MDIPRQRTSSHIRKSELEPIPPLGSEPSIEKLLSEASAYEYEITGRQRGELHYYYNLNPDEEHEHHENLRKALKIYISLARQGNVQAQLRLGVALYRMASGARHHDYSQQDQLAWKAKQLFEKAAEQGLAYLEDARTLGNRDACHLLEMFNRGKYGYQPNKEIVALNQSDYSAPQHEKYVLEVAMHYAPLWESLDVNAINLEGLS